MKNSGIFARAAYSLRGLRLLWREERSFRTHCLLSGLLLLAVVLSGGSSTWLAVFAIAIGTGLAGEAFNAALERICNRIQPDFDPAIGTIKDIASAAAFVANMAIMACALAYAYERWGA